MALTKYQFKDAERRAIEKFLKGRRGLHTTLPLARAATADELATEAGFAEVEVGRSMNRGMMESLADFTARVLAARTDERERVLKTEVAHDRATNYVRHRR